MRVTRFLRRLSWNILNLNTNASVGFVVFILGQHWYVNKPYKAVVYHQFLGITLSQANKILYSKSNWRNASSGAPIPLKTVAIFIIILPPSMN